MGVEAQAQKADLGVVKAQDLDNLRACSMWWKKSQVIKYISGSRVQRHFLEIEETVGSGRYRIAVLQVGCLHGGRISAGTVIMIVKEDNDSTGKDEVLVQRIFWNDAIFVVELHVLELELNGVPV